MKPAVAIVVIGGGYWAYKNGHLDGLIAQAKPLIARLAPKGQGETVTPAVARVERPAPLTKEEKILQRNMADVQPWARANLAWVAAMMWAESLGHNTAVSHKGARGVLQVMPGTQGDLYKWGWNKYPPDPNMLHSENIGVYYGTAYLEYLSGQSSDREWITRAYNAGPAGKLSNGTWPKETVKYLAKIKEKHAEIISNKELA